MSLAWEVTADDIAIVLVRNGITANSNEVFDEHFVGDTENCNRVEEAVLSYSDFDEQCDAALSEIAAILTDVGVMNG